METEEPVARFDTQQMVDDMATRGLNKQGLARRARVSDMTVIRFLRGESQTHPTARKLASALGYSVRRYLRKAAA